MHFSVHMLATVGGLMSHQRWAFDHVRWPYSIHLSFSIIIFDGHMLFSLGNFPSSASQIVRIQETIRDLRAFETRRWCQLSSVQGAGQMWLACNKNLVRQSCKITRQKTSPPIKLLRRHLISEIDSCLQREMSTFVLTESTLQTAWQTNLCVDNVDQCRVFRETKLPRLLCSSNWRNRRTGSLTPATQH